MRGTGAAHAAPLSVHAPIVTDGAIAADGERIVFVGPDAELAGRPALHRAARAIDRRPRLSAVPGFVDAHTHAVFAGDRRDELRRRLAGATYAEIAAAGGGIVGTVARDARRHREDELVAEHASPARRDAGVRHDDVRRSRAATGSTSRAS